MGNREKDELKAFDFGLGFGLGMQFFYGLQVGVGYNIGLYNLSPYADDKLKNHGLAITVIYLFGK